MILHLTPLGIIEERGKQYKIIRFADSLEESGEIFYKILKGDKETLNRIFGEKKKIKTTSYK